MWVKLLVTKSEKWFLFSKTIVVSRISNYLPYYINFIKMSRESFCTGRIVIGLISILIGLQVLSYGGQTTFDQSLHELRKTYMPSVLATQPVCSGTPLTWEELNQYLIQGEGALFILSGLLLILNFKCAGSLLLTIAVSLIILVKDYPWLRHSALKSTL